MTKCSSIWQNVDLDDNMLIWLWTIWFWQYDIDLDDKMLILIQNIDLDDKNINLDDKMLILIQNVDLDDKMLILMTKCWSWWQNDSCVIPMAKTFLMA